MEKFTSCNQSIDKTGRICESSKNQTKPDKFYSQSTDNLIYDWSDLDQESIDVGKMKLLDENKEDICNSERYVDVSIGKRLR